MLADAPIANPVAATLSQFLPSLTFRTTFTPPVDMSIVQNPLSGPPDPILYLLRPTVDFNTPLGPLTVAPYGEAPVFAGTETWGLLMGLGIAAFAGVFFYLGVKAGRRS